MLGYWLSKHGRNVPMPIKRGVADAVRRLYTERAALRYDGLSRQIRMADVIELTHPTPRDDASVGAVQVPARPSSPRRCRRRRSGPADLSPPPPRSTRRGRRAARDALREPRSGRARRGRLLVGAPVGLAAGRHGRRGVGGGHPVDGRDGARAKPSQLRRGRHLGGGRGHGHRQDHGPGGGGAARACSRTRCGRRTSTRRRTTGSARSVTRST